MPGLVSDEDGIGEFNFSPWSVCASVNQRFPKLKGLKLTRKVHAVYGGSNKLFDHIRFFDDNGNRLCFRHRLNSGRHAINNRKKYKESLLEHG